MGNTLIKLKGMLNGISNEELAKMDLWVDNNKRINVIAINENAISFTEMLEMLKINAFHW